MSTPAPTFSGSVPRAYHACLGPLLFEAYAKDLAARFAKLAPARLLETACGTGIVTKELARALPGASIIATDLSAPMIEVAKEYVTAQAASPASAVAAHAAITFQATDACSLPFTDASFDAIACQYGVMFYPDKVKGMQEARRVLAKGGRYIFNIWDALAHNPIPRVVQETFERFFPANPPKFIPTMPYGWSDRAEIERITRAGGFANVTIETLSFPSVSPSAADAAKGWVEGTPNAAALAERGVNTPESIATVREAVRQALARNFGESPCRSTMQAVVVTAW
jgi:ubiquinone/menaquinone biosynthesis C-methylase UbiE